MRLLKIFLKMAIPFTIFMVLANYIFIKGSLQAIVMTSLIISTYQTIKIYKEENN